MRRCSPWEPKLRRSRGPARQDDVVEVWSEARRSPLEITVEPGLERLDGRRLSFVGHPRSRQPELLGSLCKERREPRHDFRASFDELAAERRDLFGPRGDRVAGRIAAGRAPQCRVALRHRRGVLDRQRSACRGEAADHPVEVRAAHRRTTLHHREPVGREDERGDFTA